MKAPGNTERSDFEYSSTESGTPQTASESARSADADATPRINSAIAHREITACGNPDKRAISKTRPEQQIRELERQIRKLTEANQRLKEAATTDTLTGVFNRHELMARLRQEVRRYRRYRQPLSLLILDLDDFKSINDRYGHQTGDCVLRRTGETLAAISREFDVPGRYGGEEFLLILPETGEGEAARMAERLRVAIAAISLRSFGHCVRFTCSIGVAEHVPGMNSANLLHRADQAMYEAKSRGKNCVQISRLPGDARCLADSRSIPCNSY